MLERLTSALRRFGAGYVQRFRVAGIPGKIGLGCLPLLVACCCLGILIPSNPAAQTGTVALGTPGTSATNAPPVVSTVATPEPTRTTAPTTPPSPTETPGPTDTPRPTNTPAPPTETPIPPTPTEPPAPIVLSGQGQQVTERITPSSSVSRLILEHSGQRNFIVTVYTAAGDEDLLVNTIGAYTGQRPLYGKGEVFFEVDGDGPWSITVEPIPEEQAAAQGFEGSGDAVSGIFLPEANGPTPYTFTHTGERNFVVQLVCASGADLLQNEIGAVDSAAVVRFGDAPCLWEVEADGAWTIRPQ